MKDGIIGSKSIPLKESITSYSDSGVETIANALRCRNTLRRHDIMQVSKAHIRSTFEHFSVNCI